MSTTSLAHYTGLIYRGLKKLPILLITLTQGRLSCAGKPSDNGSEQDARRAAAALRTTAAITTRSPAYFKLQALVVVITASVTLLRRAGLIE